MASLENDSQPASAESGQPDNPDIAKIKEPKPSSLSGGGGGAAGLRVQPPATDNAEITLDAQGTILTWGPESEMLHGYTNDEIVGKHLSILYGDDDIRAKELGRKLEMCIADGRVEDHEWCYAKDGGRLWARYIFTYLCKDDVHVGFGLAIRDDTKDKMMEQRSTLASEDSHEPRPPTHNIQGIHPVYHLAPLIPPSAQRQVLMNGIPTSNSVPMTTATETPRDTMLPPNPSPPQCQPRGPPQQPYTCPSPPVDDGFEEIRKIAPSKRILICEDNRVNQRILSKIFGRKFGFTNITVAENGAQGVDMVRSSAEGFDMILMDIKMPVLDGYDATVQIREMGVRIPIIGMVLYGVEAEVEKALAKGMDDTFFKPMRIIDVGSKLLKFLPRMMEEPVYRGRVVCRSKL
ncbi:CheY-like superfamily [Phialemonium atrogriseum]|uniref:CheY-like superfamily n=1 Tax=Phialemonium atrogriseum TaxID=1093897 RepID=A0AAJ0BQX6_9PEZI|nr:CheY-like superfamily [Phialemonium atrogriseum]KAK1762830.1 CheY-like superfamily [Phialemonium atrogriseum]